MAGEAPFISAIELYVTPFDWWGNGWDSSEDNVVSDLTAGRVIGFSVEVRDYDPPQVHRDSKVLQLEGVGRGGALLRGDGLHDGVLLPIEPEGTAVEGSTWGRIKASLKFE